LVSFKNYEVEQEDEFGSYFGKYEQRYLDYYINKITIEFKNFPEFDYNHLVSHLWIEYKGKILGEYTLLFSFDGEIYDSNLVMF